MYKICDRKNQKNKNQFMQLRGIFSFYLFMLKAFFSSNTRIKLLHTFLLNPDEEFFIRELTRKLDEQINSIRRELDNLKKVGLLRSKMRNRKKYYVINKDFIIYNELRDIIVKASSTDEQIARKIVKMGDVELMILGGAYIGKDSPVDLLLVGEVDRNRLQEYLASSKINNKEVKFTIISRKDFFYRLECKDRFVYDMIRDPKHLIMVNKLKKELEKYQL